MNSFEKYLIIMDDSKSRPFLYRKKYVSVTKNQLFSMHRANDPFVCNMMVLAIPSG